jgi:hypothetical protein
VRCPALFGPGTFCNGFEDGVEKGVVPLERVVVASNADTPPLEDEEPYPEGMTVNVGTGVGVWVALTILPPAALAANGVGPPPRVCECLDSAPSDFECSCRRENEDEASARLWNSERSTSALLLASGVALMVMAKRTAINMACHVFLILTVKSMFVEIKE